MLLRALAPDPADRWPDIASFAGALRSLAPGGRAPRPARSSRRTQYLARRPPSLVEPRMSGAAWGFVCLLAFAVAFGLGFALEVARS